MLSDQPEWAEVTKCCDVFINMGALPLKVNLGEFGPASEGRISTNEKKIKEGSSQQERYY